MSNAHTSSNARRHDSHGPAKYARHYVTDPPKRLVPPVGRDLLGQVFAGTVVVVGLELVTTILSLLGTLLALSGTLDYGVMPLVIEILYPMVGSVLFSAAAALTGLYLLRLDRPLSTGAVLGRVAVGGAIGTAVLIGASLVWILLSMGEAQATIIVNQGFLQPIARGLEYTALFALGVLIIRSLAAAPARKPASMHAAPPASMHAAPPA
jgi:hypothetical protein